MTSELSTVVQAIITDENEKYFSFKRVRNIPSKRTTLLNRLKIGDVVTGFFI